MIPASPRPLSSIVPPRAAALILGAITLFSASAALAGGPDPQAAPAPAAAGSNPTPSPAAPPASSASPVAPPGSAASPAAPDATSTPAAGSAPAPAAGPAPAPGSVAAAPASKDSPAPAAQPPVIVLPHVPRLLGVAVGWGWNAVDKLPVSLDGSKQQPHGLSVFTDFLWQVGGIGSGWPSWIGFMAGFLYFPGSEGVRRDSYVLEYGVLVKHGLFPGHLFRPFLSYGLGATQAWVTGVKSRGIGHLTRLSFGTDIILTKVVSLSLELGYKLMMMPTFETTPNTIPGPYDFHTCTALAGVQFGI